jgi:hypothetical protein
MVRFLERLSLIASARKALSAISPHASVPVVAAGRAWITIDGAFRDHWLRAGASVPVPASCPVVIKAERSTVALEFIACMDVNALPALHSLQCFISRCQTRLQALLTPAFWGHARSASPTECGSLCGGVR